MTNAVRNPVGLIGVTCMAVMQGLLQASIFGGIGGQKFVVDDARANSSLASNLLGLGYLITTDQFITTAFGQVLAIPQARPVFDREIANHMYSPTAYYFAMQITSAASLFLYPFFVSMTAYWFYGFEVASLESYLCFAGVLSMTALAGSMFGLMFGTFMKNEVAAVGLCYFSIMIFSFGAGLMVNTSDPNPVV